MKKCVRFMLYIVLTTMPCSIVLPVQNALDVKEQSKAQLLSKRFHETYVKLRQYVHCFTSHQDCSKARKIAWGALVVFLLILYGIYIEKTDKKSEEKSEKFKEKAKRREEKYMGPHREILREHGY